MLNREGTLETFNHSEALELLPAPLRLERAREFAEKSYRQASAKKALASARDLLEVAQREHSVLAEARAHLLMAIALRRSGDRVQARHKYAICEKLILPLLNEARSPEQKAAAEIQIDLHLEEAILLFLESDFIESARKNERAAKLAESLSKEEVACRAWLNTAVSWDRAKEIREATACLENGKRILSTLPPTSLHTSYLLFSWKLGIDHGPLSKPEALPPQSTLSQKTLYLLYGWEHALMTGSMGDAELAQARLETHLHTIQEKQFGAEISALKALSNRLHLGRGSSSGTSFHIAAALQECLIKGSWKKLESEASLASNHSHPVVQAWGARAQAWLQARSKNMSQAKRHLEKALTIARSQGMQHFATCVEQELAESSELLESYSPQERKVATKWASFLPTRTDQFLVCNRTAKKLTSTQDAISEMDEALRGKGLYANALLVDGARQLIRLPQKNKASVLIQIEKLPVQRKLLFSLLAAYPHSVSKEDLVSQVWDELYNPLVHDAVLYRTASRLRKLLGGRWISTDSGALRVNAGDRPFLAILPDDQTRLRQSPLDDRKIRILTLLKYRRRVTRTEAVKALNAPERTVARDLAYLVDQKLAIRHGAGRGTVYVPAL